MIGKHVRAGIKRDSTVLPYMKCIKTMHRGFEGEEENYHSCALNNRSMLRTALSFLSLPYTCDLLRKNVEFSMRAAALKHAAVVHNERFLQLDEWQNRAR